MSVIDTNSSSSADRILAARFARGWWASTASASWWPTVWTGLSDVSGSWKIMPIRLPRSRRRRAGRGAEQLLAGEPHGSGRLGPGAEEPQQRQHRDALARARLADDRDALALADIEVDTANGLQWVLRVGAEADVQVADLEQRFGHAAPIPAP